MSEIIGKHGASRSDTVLVVKQFLQPAALVVHSGSKG